MVDVAKPLRDGMWTKHGDRQIFVLNLLSKLGL